MLFDDRDARPGVKFADDELLGIPHRIVIGDKGLERGVLEYKRAPRRRWRRRAGRLRWSHFLRDERSGAAPLSAHAPRAAPSPCCCCRCALPWPAARADRQMDPELRGVIAAAHRAHATASTTVRARGLVRDDGAAPQRATSRTTSEREQILHHVHCEAKRVDVPPELVLAVMDVESRFDRYAVSSAGAVGLMQVMPFWPRELGMTNDQLVRIPDNVRMGTTILGYYLRKERGNYQRALQRYNGSLGRPHLLRPGDRPAGVALAVATDHGAGASATCGTHRGQGCDRSRRQRPRPPPRVTLRGRRALPEPGAQRLDGLRLAAGQHLDPAVGQVARVAGDAQRLGAGARAGAVEDALHAAGDEAAAGDQGVIGRQREPAPAAALRRGGGPRWPWSRASSASSRASRYSPLVQVGLRALLSSCLRLGQQLRARAAAAPACSAARIAWRALLISCTGAPAQPPSGAPAEQRASSERQDVRGE